MNTGSNIKKAINTDVIKDESEILPPLSIPIFNSVNLNNHQSHQRTKSNFNIQPYNAIPNNITPSRGNVADMLVSEWIDPTNFIEMTPIPANITNEIHSEISSPMCIELGNQSAFFNMAVIDEDDRILRMRHRLKQLHQTIPNVFGPLKVDFINVRLEKEPAKLPSPLKEINTSTTNGSPQMVSLPPIFNHPI